MLEHVRRRFHKQSLDMTHERIFIMATGIKIGNYNFEGPVIDFMKLRDQSGVYAVLGGAVASPWTVVDVGESAQIRSRLSCHERALCWKRQRHPILAYAAWYCDANQRVQVEQEIRTRYMPSCGEQ